MSRISHQIRRVARRFMGGSTLFNGTTSTIPTTVTANTDFTSGFVLFGWVRTLSRGETSGRVFDKSSGTSGDNGFQINMGTSNRLVFQVNGGTSRTSANGAIKYNAWQHILVHVASNAMVSIYVDGVLSGTPGTTGALAGITTANSLTIGNRSTGTDSTFHGRMAELGIISLAGRGNLSATEIANLYQNGTLPSGTAHFWKLDDLPSSYLDSIGGNTGTGANTTYSPDTPIQQRVVRSDDKASLLFGAATTDRIEVSTPPELRILTNPGEEINVTFIAKLNREIGNDEAFFRRVGSIAFGRQATNNIEAYCYVNASGDFSGNRQLRCAYNTPLVNRLLKQTWNTVTVCWYINSTNNLRSKLYINGECVSDVGVDYTGSSATPTGVLYIGNRGATAPVKGNIKALWIHNGALTDEQRRSMHFSRVIPRENLVSEYTVDEGAGPTVYDTSGNGNHGTITGATWSSDTPIKARVAHPTRISHP